MPPLRSNQRELLDQAITDQAALAANLRDIAVADRLIGATRLAWRLLRPHLMQGRSYSLLDVAAGGADVPYQIARRARQAGFVVQPYASDHLLEMMLLARMRQPARAGQASMPLLVHDALAMPFADHSVDFVTCSLALHHFAPSEVTSLVQEMARISRCVTIIVDLQRTWVGYCGARLMALGPWDAMARHDGPLSVLRAYTPAEFRGLAAAADLPIKVGSAGPLLMYGVHVKQ
jgi:2-polyprenyl-3-methyl-5-hydroxy-6-metoxy-1,4-benzoquinol methylase